MVELNQNYLDIEEALFHIKDGVLLIYQKGSGSFLMLNNLLSSFHNDIYGSFVDLFNVFSINEFHPLFDDFNKTYGIPNNSAVLIIVDCKIVEIFHSPISKNRLLNSLQTIAKT